jgi:hypothetical protein
MAHAINTMITPDIELLNDSILTSLLAGKKIRKQNMYILDQDTGKYHCFTKSQVKERMEQICLELFDATEPPQYSYEYLFTVLAQYEREDLDRYQDIRLFDVASGKHITVPKRVVSRYCNMIDGTSRMRADRKKWASWLLDSI